MDKIIVTQASQARPRRMTELDMSNRRDTSLVGKPADLLVSGGIFAHPRNSVYVRLEGGTYG
jgi:hypothetical protein